jgi:hypothetical protein
MTARMPFAAVATVLVATGCANLQTIDRQTSFDRSGLGTKGLAIHLDANQRLVVFSAQKYCAEPSPDVTSP